MSFTNNTYEESKKGDEIIKKILITLLTLCTAISIVKAEEYPEITNDIEIRYRWYKEIVSKEGEYYPLKDVKETDNVDKNNIKYIGTGNLYKKEHCSLPSEYYLIKEKHMKEYRKVYDVFYAMIEDVESLENIQIYYENEPLNFKVMNFENNIAHIYLAKSCMPEKLMFYIEDNNYSIGLYRDGQFKKQMLYKSLKNKMLAIPDKHWITSNTEYNIYSTLETYKENDFTKFITEKVICAYQEKYVYKYETTKEYYDNNYHQYVEGYIKDTNDYKIYYKKEPIHNTIEITKEKTVEVPKIEYVYIDIPSQENDSSNLNECKEKIITQTKTEYIEKEISKIPKKFYIILFILFTVILIIIRKIYKKSVE